MNESSSAERREHHHPDTNFRVCAAGCLCTDKENRIGFIRTNEHARCRRCGRLMHKKCSAYNTGNAYCCLKCGQKLEEIPYDNGAYPDSDEDDIPLLQVKQSDSDYDSDYDSDLDGTDGRFHPDVEDLCSKS